MIPIKSLTLFAMTSRVGTVTIGFFNANAMPFTTVTPIRSPVNEPGPMLIAKQSISLSLSPELLSNLSIMGTSRIECLMSAFL